MEDANLDIMENQLLAPTWEFMAQSPTLEVISSNYKIKLKYGGYFRLAKRSSKQRYCFGYQKSIYIDTCLYNFEDLLEEVTKIYPSNRDLVFSVYFVDKNVAEQPYMNLDSQEKFQLMLSMYEVEKELTVYVTTNNNNDTDVIKQRGQDEVNEEPHGDEPTGDEPNDDEKRDEESEYSLGDDGYHSHYSTDNEFESDNHVEETFSLSNKSPSIKINSTFDNVVVFRRALIHYAVTNEFEYFIEKSEPKRVTATCVHKECNWRIHASVMQDGVTFKVRTFVEAHSCTRSNKGGNRLTWTYSANKHDRLLNEIAVANKDAIAYINQNHNKIWSRSKFGTLSKCDYLTNNISEAFNSWIGELRYKPVLDLLDSIREKIMVRIDKKRRIVKKWKGPLVPSTKSYLNKFSKNLGKYEVCRSGENRAEVKFEDWRWEVLLDERKCTCRVWQVKGVPCVHAATFIAFIRDVSWDKYVDSYFTIEKYKSAYALEVAPMPAMDLWDHVDVEEKIYPPAYYQTSAWKTKKE